MKKLQNFKNKFKSEVKRVQTYQGEKYSLPFKKGIASLVKSGISRYRVAKEIGIHYTLVRNYDLKFNN